MNVNDLHKHMTFINTWTHDQPDISPFVTCLLTDKEKKSFYCKRQQHPEGGDVCFWKILDKMMTLALLLFPVSDVDWISHTFVPGAPVLPKSPWEVINIEIVSEEITDMTFPLIWVLTVNSWPSQYVAINPKMKKSLHSIEMQGWHDRLYTCSSSLNIANTYTERCVVRVPSIDYL